MNEKHDVNNHSAMVVGKFILALSVQFEFYFILWLGFLRFCMKMIWVLNYKN